MSSLEIIPVEGLPEVGIGDDLAMLISSRIEFRDGDVLVVAQKVVSKAEGRVRDVTRVAPSPRAVEIAAQMGDERDPRLVQVVLDESVDVVRVTRGLLITETKHGFVCANAAVDHSNVSDSEDLVTVLPEDPDVSAARLRTRLRDLTAREVSVIVSDTFGRAWRLGSVNVALGVAGLPALLDYRGQTDDHGRVLQGTEIAAADELAAASELVMGKTGRVPAVVIRGWRWEAPAGTGRDLIMPKYRDLFR